jgi:hypothetical protein
VGTTAIILARPGGSVNIRGQCDRRFVDVVVDRPQSRPVQRNRMRGDELRAVHIYMLRLRKRARGTSDRLVFELLAERDRMRHGLVQPLDIELVLPPADDDSSNAIADQIR